MMDRRSGDRRAALEPSRMQTEAVNEQCSFYEIEVNAKWYA